MQVRIRLFAALAEAAGTRALVLDVPAGSTAGIVREAVMNQLPRLQGLCRRAALAVNAEYTDADHEIHDGDELALIPPVSGGCLGATEC